MESTSLELVLDETLDWQPACGHSQHEDGLHGHSNESPILVVAGRAIACCGFTSAVRFLCEWWWLNTTDSHLVRCPGCREAVYLEDCYTVIGRA